MGLPTYIHKTTFLPREGSSKETSTFLEQLFTPQQMRNASSRQLASPSPSTTHQPMSGNVQAWDLPAARVGKGNDSGSRA